MVVAAMKNILVLSYGQLEGGGTTHAFCLSCAQFEEGGKRVEAGGRLGVARAFYQELYIVYPCYFSS